MNPTNSSIKHWKSKYQDSSTYLKLSKAEHYKTLIDHYNAKSFLVLAVTLSTFVKSDRFAASQRYDSLWDKYFIEKVQKQLPRHLRDTSIDHEFEKERSPHGDWHFHGFLAVQHDVAHRIWNHGVLNKHLERDLRSFETCGFYRPCRVTSFDISPVRNSSSWSHYITDKYKNLRSVN